MEKSSQVWCLILDGGRDVGIKSVEGGGRCLGMERVAVLVEGSGNLGLCK